MKTSKNVKRILSVMLLVIMLTGSLHLLGKALTPVSYTTYFEHDIEVIRESGEDVDMIILGGSRALKTFVPGIFEKQLGLNCVVNASTNTQPIEGSYYYLKELLKDFHPKYVVLGVVIDGFRGTVENKNIMNNLIVYDRLKGLNRLQYFIDCIKPSDYLYGIYAYRYRNNLFNISGINKEKQKLIENNYVPDIEGQGYYYADKGFVYGKNSFIIGNMAHNGFPEVQDSNFMEERVVYLDKIVELCKANNIQLFLASPPTSEMRLYSIRNYQVAVDFFTEYAERNGIVYHNLNYLLDRTDWLSDDKMVDYNHVNGIGAGLVTERYCEILKRVFNNQDASDLLYRDLDDLKKTITRIVCVEGVITRDEKDKKAISIKVRSWHNSDIKPLYQVEVCYDGSNWETLVSWTEKDSFDLLLKDEKCKIRVWASTGDHDIHDAVQEYTLTADGITNKQIKQ